MMACFKCPVCGNDFEITPEMVNVPVICPVCAAQVTVDSAAFQMATFQTANINSGAMPPPPDMPPPVMGQAYTQTMDGFGNMCLQQQGNGIFVSDRDYNTLFQMVIQAFQQAGVTIKESNPANGVISGKSPYGINPFGMTVSCKFSSYGNNISFQITAMFTDTLDTFGATKNKIREISNIIQQQAPMLENVPRNTQMLMNLQQGNTKDYTALANTGRVFSILGFFVPFVVLAGLIISIVVLCIATDNRNDDARRIATSGLIIAICAIVLSTLIWNFAYGFF